MGAPAAADPRAAAFFDDLRCAWRSAADAVGVEEKSYLVAGAPLRVRFAGQALIAPLTRALAHLPRADSESRGLTVFAWDSESTSTAMPAPPWGTDDYREHGKIRGYFDERVHSVFQWGSRSLVMLDAEREEALYWVRAARQIPFFERAAPLRLILHGWLAGRGIQLAHAAAVGTDEGCVLLVGKAGAGKSFATLACLRDGLRHLADDYCLLRPGSPPRVCSLYSAAKTHADALALGALPFLRDIVSNPDRPDHDKAVYFLSEHIPDRLLLEAELRAILVPQITGARDTMLERASPSAALAALAPTTILQLPGADGATLARLAELVRAAPCHFLRLGTELEQVPAAISQLLSRAQ